ncbi:hypothetical protein EV401DRAFT_1983976 [Pisolithus croceorrhizus]|nr:hypothetical protein EV401DRAFT_1983976 [Pisolithus croceorrhizus]
MSIVVVTEELCSASNFLRTYSHGFPFARTAYPSEEIGLFINATVDDLDIIHELVGRRGSHHGAIHSNTQIQLEDMIPDKFCKIVPSVSHVRQIYIFNYLWLTLLLSAPKSVKKIYTVSPSGVVPAGDISESEPVIGFVIPNVCTDHDRAALVQALNFLPSVPNFILPELHSPTPGEERTSPMIKVESVHSHGSNQPYPSLSPSLCAASLLESSTLRETSPLSMPSPSPPCTPTSAPCFLNEHNYNCYAFLDNGR